MRTALVIGGTGPTGPHVLHGLIDRGFDVTIFHRGSHEPPGMPDIEHIHGDPHFRETIDEALGDRSFDVVLAMYGRVRILSEVLAGRCEQFLAVGGTPIYRGFNEPELGRPYGLPVPTREDSPLVDTLGDTDLTSVRFGQLILKTERAVLDTHPVSACFRYPVIYGPRNPVPWEWSVIKRVRDGRSHMVVPDDGLNIHHRCAARNAAEFLLRAVDEPKAAAGQAFNVGDESLWTQRQWISLIVERLGGSLELVGIPSEIAVEAHAAQTPLNSSISPHSILSIDKARRDLGYRDVVDPVDALNETVDWVAANEPDPASHPAFLDRFDYDREDALIAAWRSGRDRILAAAPQERPESFHGMPHPKAPGASDQRGR